MANHAGRIERRNRRASYQLLISASALPKKDRSFAGSHSTKQTWARVPKQSNLKRAKYLLSATTGRALPRQPHTPSAATHSLRTRRPCGWRRRLPSGWFAAGSATRSAAGRHGTARSSGGRGAAMMAVFVDATRPSSGDSLQRVASEAVASIRQAHGHLYRGRFAE